MNISELRKIVFAALLALMALAMLPACSTTEEEEEAGTTKDEICNEADAGTTECPEVR